MRLRVRMSASLASEKRSVLQPHSVLNMNFGTAGAGKTTTIKELVKPTDAFDASDAPVDEERRHGSRARDASAGAGQRPPSSSRYCLPPTEERRVITNSLTGVVNSEHVAQLLAESAQISTPNSRASFTAATGCEAITERRLGVTPLHRSSTQQESRAALPR
jgi:hypothetical protein